MGAQLFLALMKVLEVESLPLDELRLKRERKHPRL